MNIYTNLWLKVYIRGRLAWFTLMSLFVVAIRVYRVIGDVGMVMALQTIRVRLNYTSCTVAYLRFPSSFLTLFHSFQTSDVLQA